MKVKTDKVKDALKFNLQKMCSIFGVKYDWSIMEELDQDADFLYCLNSQIAKNGVFRTRKFNSIYQFSVYRNLMYYLIRILKPKAIVETGVYHGLTSAWMLNAILKNASGKLLSIDLPRRDWNKYFKGVQFGPGGDVELDEFPEGEDPGWIIPEKLKCNWELFKGPSTKYLEKVLDENDVDLFVHDSDHSYDTMKFECESVLNKKPNALVVIDDYSDNNYFYEFLSKNSVDHMFLDEINDKLEFVTCTAICRLKSQDK